MAEKLTLSKGDTLMLYTDGVPDAKSPDGKRYTIERMLRVMNENSGMDPEKTVKSLKADIDSFQPADDPFDDITILCIRYGSGKEYSKTLMTAAGSAPAAFVFVVFFLTFCY